ncbi:hypothetical protein ISN45_Un109g000030 [Arabidopsis thaliana x Arabidopsis arenosa]|uniref:Uncharacterized protein n=1 Tax=Arabidopsis thaliana x Arabidopsis arenosa TaxID=1240361 RepID=A0A8T1XEV3_9BRAS|nr:hypothetical protein ISN45_Un109g000030 [Arabidopsis thaliana x Arabidopsis arenosa]
MQRSTTLTLDSAKVLRSNLIQRPKARSPLLMLSAEKDGCRSNSVYNPYNDRVYETKSDFSGSERSFVVEDNGNYVVVWQFEKNQFLGFCRTGDDHYREIPTQLEVQRELRDEDGFKDVSEKHRLPMWMPRLTMKERESRNHASFWFDSWTPLGPLYNCFGSSGPSSLRVPLNATVSDVYFGPSPTKPGSLLGGFRFRILVASALSPRRVEITYFCLVISPSTCGMRLVEVNMQGIHFTLWAELLSWLKSGTEVASYSQKAHCPNRSSMQSGSTEQSATQSCLCPSLGGLSRSGPRSEELHHCPTTQQRFSRLISLVALIRCLS